MCNEHKHRDEKLIRLKNPINNFPIFFFTKLLYYE